MFHEEHVLQPSPLYRTLVSTCHVVGVCSDDTSIQPRGVPVDLTTRGLDSVHQVRLFVSTVLPVCFTEPIHHVSFGRLLPR